MYSLIWDYQLKLISYFMSLFDQLSTHFFTCRSSYSGSNIVSTIHRSIEVRRSDQKPTKNSRNQPQCKGSSIIMKARSLSQRSPAHTNTTPRWAVDASAPALITHTYQTKNFTHTHMSATQS
jgi:hypothetical protein